MKSIAPGMADINRLQNTLRTLLNAYINGLYLRRIARYGYPVLWKVSPYAVTQAIHELTKALLPLRHELAVTELLDHIKEQTSNAGSSPEKILVEALSAGYRYLGQIFAIREDIRQRALPTASPFHRGAYLGLDKKYFLPVVDLEHYTVSTLAPYLMDAWIHGSVADLGIAKGYSDLDVLFVLAPETVTEANRLQSFARKCYRANIYLNAFDHLHHHGFQIITAIDWMAYPESWLPLKSLSEGVTLLNQSVLVGVRSSQLDAQEAFEKTVESFILRIRRNWVPKDAYEWKYFLSVLMLLPTQFWQAQGDFCTKRESFPKLAEFGGALDDSVLQQASDVRFCWPNVQIPYLFRFLNPTMLRRLYASRATPVLNLLSNTMVRDAASFAVRLARLVENGRGPQISLMGQALTIFNEPIAYTLADYDSAREDYVEETAGEDSIVAILEFGTLTEPGISDLDFLVVVHDNTRVNPASLSIRRLSQAQADIIMHEPVVIPFALVPHIRAWLPFAKLSILYQRDSTFDLPTYVEEEQESYAEVARLLEKLNAFYKWFQYAHKTQKIDARWSLAILKSLIYSVSSVQRITARLLSDAETFAFDLRMLRANWFRDSYSLLHREQLRSVFERGKQLCEESTAAIADWLQANRWMSIDDQDSTAILLRLDGLYACGHDLANVSTASPDSEPQTPFETYLAWRATILRQQQRFLQANNISFGSLL